MKFLLQEAHIHYNGEVSFWSSFEKEVGGESENVNESS